MAYVSNVVDKELLIVFEDAIIDGKMKYKRKSFNVKDTATDEQIYDVGMTLASLSSKVLQSINSRTLNEIEEM